MTPEQWERVGQLVNAAIALQPDKRPSFLDQACGQDETLRREVESFLTLEGKDRGFLSAPAMEEAAKLFVKAEPRFPASKRLGNYEVLEFLESGGMGEIYKARNVSLGNTVALKFLPTALAEDANRLRRFKQEARAASALNHPNIITVHDFVEAEQSHFIVSEYVEGETLRQRLRQGPLPLQDAIGIATQVATGLAAAHAVGVIHRDIKPENIMLRPDGYVKVLDFGLAKLSEQYDIDLSMDAQLKTDPGVKMGTTRYMSPEQACGLAMDSRTDVWSLGIVIYEMLSGRVPFDGPTNGDVLTSILEREPAPLASLVSEVPLKLQRIVAKALQKDRNERYQHVKDMLVDLKGRSKRLDYENLVVKIKRHKTAAAVMLAGLVVVAVIAWRYGPWSHHAFPPPLPPMKVTPLTSFLGFETSPAFSPDGNFVAFCWGGEKDDNIDIYIQQIGNDGPPFRLTSDPAADLFPVWSPDGTQIAFSRFKSETEKALFVISRLGGPERRIRSSEVRSIWGGEKQIDWSPDDKSIVGPDKLSEDGPYQILLTSLETLKDRQLTFVTDKSFGDLSPQFSPDGQSVAFIRIVGNDLSTQDIYIVPVVGGEPRRLTFDNHHIQGLAWTADGREIVFSSNRDGLSKLWRLNASGGTPEPVAISDVGTVAPAIARIGNRLAFSKKISDSNIYRISLDRSARSPGASTMFASSTQPDGNPNFSSDGKKIAFVSERSGQHEIWSCNDDGSGLIKLTSLATFSGSPRWSPDGQQIAFDSLPKESGTRDIYVISSQGGAPRRLTTEDDYDDMIPSWSKDGQWIYFTSKRSGDWQVWKMPAFGGDPVQVTKQGGYMAFEASDGNVYYAKSPTASGIWTVPVNGGNEVPVLQSVAGYWANWAVARDGIYYIEPETKKGAAIEYYNFTTRRITEVAPLGKVALSWFGFAISPDGQTALYTTNHEGSDIMLVENFR